MLKRNGGFSLVELMAVCAVIGIIMAIAIPYYVSYKRATCDRVAQEDLVNIAAAWEKYINDESNLKHKAPQDLKDLAGEFYGWGGTSTKCDVRFYLDHSTLTVYSASYKGSHPRGPGSRYMYMMKMPAGLTPSSAKLDNGPGLFWSILGSIGSFLEPAPAYAKSNNNNQSNKGGSSGSEDNSSSDSSTQSRNQNQNQSQNQGGNQNQNQNQNQNGNQGNSDSNHQDRNTNGNQNGQGEANGNAWGQGNGNNGNANDNSGNSGSGGQAGSGSTGGSSSDSTPSDTGASGGSGSDSGTSSAGGSGTGASSGGGGSSTAGGSDSGTAGSAGGTSGGTTDSAAVTEGAALTGSKPVGLVSTTDLDSAWKAYPFGVGPASSAFDSSGNYIQR